jgi:hypothetical protein
VTDRVHDVSEYVASPCGQALLACPTGSRASPGFDELRWAGAGVSVAVSVCTLTPYTHIHTPSFTAHVQLAAVAGQGHLRMSASSCDPEG